MIGVVSRVTAPSHPRSSSSSTARPPIRRSGWRTVASRGTLDHRSGALYLKIVNPEASTQILRIELQGVRRVTRVGRAHTLAAAPDATLAEPVNVVPVVTKLSGLAPTFTHQIAPHSITLLELKAR